MVTYHQSGRLAARLVRLVGDCLAKRHAANGRLCIINYHRILEASDPLIGGEPDIAAFRWQMQLLADCFNVMPLGLALTAMAANRLPPRAICITFDDGYRSTHDLALPILKEFSLPATVFVTTAFIADGNMWNDTIREAVRNMDGKTLDLREHNWGLYAIGTLEQRKQAVLRLTQMAKYFPPADRLALTRELTQRTNGHAVSNLMLTPDMIRTLEDNRFEIGGHTVSHPILTSLDESAARFEIEECKRHLEDICRQPIRYFAYPNGKYGIDFSERDVALVREAGFSAAFSTALGAATAGDDFYRLPRSLPWDATRGLYVLRLLRWLAH